MTFGNPQVEYSKMFSLVILSLTLQKSAYYSKFLHHSVKKKVRKISERNRRAIALISIKQSKHKLNAVK